MPNITIKFKNGGMRVFAPQQRAGGSYSNRLKYEGAFVVVVDEWGNSTAFPAADISEVVEDNGRAW